MKKKTKKITKSKLIGKGSYGCVFRPEIPCKKTLKDRKNITKTKRSRKKVSKVMLQESDYEIKKEFNMDKEIKKSSNYKEWAYIWDKLCRPPSYTNMNVLSEINKCLKKFKKTKDDYSKHAYMLIGEYGGNPLFDHCLKMFKKTTFNSLKLFKKNFLKLFKDIEPLFVGLIELQKLNMSHQDLSISNIMYKNNQFFIIDFGLSCKFSDTKSFKKRSLAQLNGSRVYSPYPYDYIYCHGTKQELKSELNSVNRDIDRNHHDDYLRIHKGIFGRKTIEDDIRNDLGKVNKNKKLVLKKLDTYSIGILLMHLICDIADHYNVTNKKIYKCFDQVDIQNHLALFKDMTEYYSKDRIDPEEAYERYKSLL